MDLSVAIAKRLKIKEFLLLINGLKKVTMQASGWMSVDSELGY